METIYFLYALLLIILAFAVYHLTKKSEVDAEVTELAKRDDSHLLAELHSVRITVWICFIGAMLLTANYAITYFSGSSVSNIREWGLYQWSGAFIGLVVTVAISLVQKVLYASPTSHKAALLVTTLILSFVIFSEIGSPIEKEEMKMKEASQNSPTYQAVIGAIGQSTTSSPSAYSNQLAEAQAKKAKHEFELGRCDRHQSKGAKRVQRCVDYENRKIAEAQAQIASFNSNMQSEAQQNQATTLSLVNEAKALETNTDHHSGLIKFVQQAFDTSFLNAMMLASLILVVAFEAGFHFAGSREGMLKAALIQRGNKDITLASEARRIKKMQDFKRQTEKHQRYLANQDEENKTTQDTDAPEVKIKKDKPSPSPSFKPATQFTSNEHTGTNEKQYDLFAGKKNGASNAPAKQSGQDFETVQATSYDTIKTEIESGNLPQDKNAIARYIHEDTNQKLSFPQCQKVADVVLDRLENEAEKPVQTASKKEKYKGEFLQEIADNKAKILRLKTRPLPAENNGADTVSQKDENNRVATVEDNRSATVETVAKKDTVDDETINKLNETNFSRLYAHISSEVKAGKVKPSARALTDATHQYVKSDGTLKKASVSLPDSRYLANQIRDKMLQEGIIQDNPNYKNGVARYLVA